MELLSFAPAVERLALALGARGERLAAAESCTGGLIAAACTARAGSSDWFERGFVTYSNEAKTELLGVPAALIGAHGAVSEEVARAMVAGALVQAQLSIHSGSRVVGLQILGCQTAANGQCTLVWTGPTLGSTHTGAVLDVKAVSRPYLVYSPGALTQATVGTVR